MALLPPGNYRCVITEAQTVITKAQSRVAVKLKLVIVDPEKYAGEYLYAYPWVHPQEGEKLVLSRVRYQLKYLYSFLKAVDPKRKYRPRQWKNLNDLIKQLNGRIIIVGVYQVIRDKQIYNTVRSYYPTK